MATLEHQIRKALKLLDRYDTVDRGELAIAGVGDKTISVLLESEWATLSLSPSKIKKYSITDAGRHEAKRPEPPKATKRQPIPMVQPRIPITDTRRVRPK